MDAAEAPRACAAPGIVRKAIVGGGSWFLGYVRRRDEIATGKIAAAARRTIPEGSRTTFVVGAYSFGANFLVHPPNFPSHPVPYLYAESAFWLVPYRR